MSIPEPDEKSRTDSGTLRVGEPRRTDLCFLDVETTGARIGFHEIIEIAAIRTVPDASRILSTWHNRVRPRHPERISLYAKNLTGFDSTLWKEAELPSVRLWKEFVCFADGCIPVCHNPSFDRAFVSLAAGENGIVDLGLDYHWIGTESLAWPLYVSGRITKLSLEGICEAFGIPVEPLPHTAMDGAQACLLAYRALIAHLTAEDFPVNLGYLKR